MRCPKCGYISFDQQQSCKKCSADLAEIAASLSGTGVRAEEGFFLASVLVGAGHGEEEREFDLSEMVVDEEVTLPGLEPAEEDEVPVVSLEGFEQGEEAADEEEISLTLPEEETEQEGAVEAGAGEEEGVGGTIEFSMGEDELQGVSVSDLLLEREESPAAQAEASESPQEGGGIEFQLEEAAEKPEPEQSETEEGGIDFDFGLMPEIEMDEEPPAATPEEEAPEAKSDSGLNLDLDVDLEDEPAEEDLVFNLEDIDMADLVIGENGEEKKAGRPEDTALDLEDFLSEGKGSNE